MMQRGPSEPPFRHSSPRWFRGPLPLWGLALLVLLGVAAGLSAARYSSASGEPVPSPERATAELALPPVAAAPPPAVASSASPPVERIVEGELEHGDTLASALDERDVAPEVVHQISTALSPLFDFRRAQKGHEFRLAEAADGSLVEFRYRTSLTESYRVVRTAEGLRAQREEDELVPRTERLAGVIVSTLYKAVTDLGENGQLARDFAEVFAWDIDFQRSVQPGDRFQVLYERLYREEEDGSETYVRPGRILAARYEGTAGLHTAVYFETKEGHGGYYRPDGKSVEGQFLMAPLRHARVSSSYSAARLHPILNIIRPHHGIDYAAPTGTPVWAVADGEVIYRARAGGFGNLVKIRHANGYVSYYAHLSRFAKHLKVGQKVAQKQVIGYVGQTGLATGPHVCFRIAKNGQYVNPARLRTPSGAPVPSELAATFRATSAVLLAELDAGTYLAAESPR
jgi:murein DD-endopeptidase MepM/ murein hydrolase activator NlpD